MSPTRSFELDWSRPETHLALDEAMLLEADRAGFQESVRVWRFPAPVVVLGRSSKWQREVDQAYCQRHGIPVLRRCSGGAAIVAGPGCLMYSVVLGFQTRPELQKIDLAHQFVMSRLAKSLQSQLPAVQLQGICDLTWKDRKFSGNSLRVGRHHVLYHGTILHAADLALIGNCLTPPPRQPEYRRRRDHVEFLINVPVEPQRLASEVHAAFSDVGGHVQASLEADEDGDAVVERFGLGVVERANTLLSLRYLDADWHRRH